MNSLYNNSNTQPIVIGNPVRQSTLGIAPLPTLGGWKTVTSSNSSIPTYDFITDQARGLPIQSSLSITQTNTLFTDFQRNSGYFQVYDTPSSREEALSTDGDNGQAKPIVPSYSSMKF